MAELSAADGGPPLASALGLQFRLGLADISGVTGAVPSDADFRCPDAGQAPGLRLVAPPDRKGPDLRDLQVRKPCVPVQLSPELALVDPELRAWALAQLPERDEDSFLPVASSHRPTLARPVDPPIRAPGVVAAAAVYALQQSVVLVMEASALIAVVGGAAALASWLH